MSALDGGPGGLAELVEAARELDKYAVARCISLFEDRRPDAPSRREAVLGQLDRDTSRRARHVARHHGHPGVGQVDPAVAAERRPARSRRLAVDRRARGRPVEPGLRRGAAGRSHPHAVHPRRASPVLPQPGVRVGPGRPRSVELPGVPAADPPVRRRAHRDRRHRSERGRHPPPRRPCLPRAAAAGWRRGAVPEGRHHRGAPCVHPEQVRRAAVGGELPPPALLDVARPPVRRGRTADLPDQCPDGRGNGRAGSRHAVEGAGGGRERAGGARGLLLRAVGAPRSGAGSGDGS